MSKSGYIPRQESKKITWLQNFSTKLATYSTKYGVTAAELADIQAGVTAYVYWIDYANKFGEYSKKITLFKSELVNGTTGTLTVPVLPVIGTAPALPASGILKRIMAVVTNIKSKTAYTVNDGMDLGIEGTTITARDTSILKPVISVKIVTDGHPEIVWTKGGNDGVEIQVDKGNGTWQFLGIDLKPNYIDTSALPGSGQSEVRKYRAIYIDDEHHIGQWSDVVEIAVKG